MRLDEYAAMDAVAIATAVRCGQVSALEVTDAAIAAIEALNPRLNALVLMDFHLPAHRKHHRSYKWFLQHVVEALCQPGL